MATATPKLPDIIERDLSALACPASATAIAALHDHIAQMIDASATLPIRLRYSSSKACQANPPLRDVPQSQRKDTPKPEVPVASWSDHFELLCRLGERRCTVTDSFGTRRLTGKDLLEWVWTRLQSTRFARVQQGFCDGRHLVTPKLSDKAELAHPTVLNTCSLSGVLLNQIPLHFAESFGLIDCKALTTRVQHLPPSERAAMRNELTFIELNSDVVRQSTARLLEATREFFPSGQRVLLVTPSVVARNPAYPDALPCGEGTAGSLVVFAGDTKTQFLVHVSNRKRPVLLQRNTVREFSSVYDFYRSRLHQAHSYSAESKSLAPIHAVCTDLIESLSRVWTGDASAELRQAMKGEIAGFAKRAEEFFRHSVDPEKVEALAFVDKIKQQLALDPKKPTLVIDNITAIQTRLCAIQNRCIARSDGLSGKNKHNESDRSQTRYLIQSYETVIGLVRETVAKSPAIVAAPRYAGLFDETANLSPEDVARQAGELLRWLNISPKRLEDLQVRPFITFADKMRVAMGEIKDAAYDRDKAGVTYGLKKLLLLTHLAEASACIEWIKRLPTFKPRVPLKSYAIVAEKFLDKMRKDTDLFADVSVTPHEEALKQVVRSIRHLAHWFRKHERVQLSAEQHQQLDKSLRKLFAKPKLQIEEIMRKL